MNNNIELYFEILSNKYKIVEKEKENENEINIFRYILCLFLMIFSSLLIVYIDNNIFNTKTILIEFTILFLQFLVVSCWLFSFVFVIKYNKKIDYSKKIIYLEVVEKIKLLENYFATEKGLTELLNYNNKNDLFKKYKNILDAENIFNRLVSNSLNSNKDNLKDILNKKSLKNKIKILNQ